MATSLSVNLEKVAKLANLSVPILFAVCAIAGYMLSFYFHFGTVTFFLLMVINFYYRHVQKKHSLLANFGFIAQARYVIESVGPELRQYLISTDVDEKPFNRIERSEVYRKAKGIDSSSAFGSQLNFDHREIKLRHSMYPVDKEKLEPYEVTFGEERGIPTGSCETSCTLLMNATVAAASTHSGWHGGEMTSSPIGTPRSSDISSVIFSLGNKPPLPGLAPCENLISIIFTGSSAASFASRSSSRVPPSLRTPNLAVPIWKIRLHFSIK